MSDNFKFVQAQPFTLSGAGATIGDNSITLTTFTQIDGTLLTMSDFGDKGFITIDPGNGTLEEQISFTGVTQNANGTATLTGISTVSMVSPYTETPNLAQSHAGGAIVVISNTAGFYNTLTSKDNDETITGVWTFTSPNYPQMNTTVVPPVLDEQFATKKYVDDIAIAGSPDATETVKGIVEIATGEEAATNAQTGSGTTSAAMVINTELTNATGGIAGRFIPVSTTTGHIHSSWGGVPSSFATLDENGDVIQNPANSTQTPAATSIPISNSDGFLDTWLSGMTKKIAVSTSVANITGTTAVVSIMSGTLPFNLIRSGTYVKSKLFFNNIDIFSGSASLSVAIGGTTIASHGIGTTDSINGSFEIVTYFNTTNSQLSVILLDYLDDPPTPPTALISATSAVVVSADKTYSIFWQASHTSTSFNPFTGYIEITS